MMQTGHRALSLKAHVYSLHGALRRGMGSKKRVIISSKTTESRADCERHQHAGGWIQVGMTAFEHQGVPHSNLSSVKSPLGS